MNPNPLLALLTETHHGHPLEVHFPEGAIRNNDPTEFLELFAWDRLQSPELLQHLHGRVRFRFQGYMNDPRGIEQIPELRTFLQDWHRVWPAWFFFADLSEEIPRRMALACLPELSLVVRVGSRTTQASYRLVDMLNFLRPEWLFIQSLSLRAHLGLSPAAERARAVWTYFNLPVEGFPAHQWPTSLP